MLSVLSRQQLKAQRNKKVDDLFQQFESSYSTTDSGTGRGSGKRNKNDGEEDKTMTKQILSNLMPVTVDLVYQQKKQQLLLKNTNQFFQSKQPNSQGLQQAIINNSSIQTQATGTQNTSIFHLGNQTGKSSEKRQSRVSFSLMETTPKTTIKTPRSDGPFKTKSQQNLPNITIDQIAEGDLFEDMLEKEQRESENLESHNLTSQQQEEMTQKWAEVEVSLKKCDRELSQDVSQTMQLINNNLKLIVQEQERKRCIRNLTSLESVFEQARSECIDIKLDLTEEIKKKKKPRQSQISNSIRLPSLANVPANKDRYNYAASQKANTIPSRSSSSQNRSPEITPNDTTTKFTKLQEDEGEISINQKKNSQKKSQQLLDQLKFKVMHQRFVTKYEAPQQSTDSWNQRKKTTRPAMIFEPKKSFHQIGYQPLQDPFQATLKKRFDFQDKSLLTNDFHGKTLNTNTSTLDFSKLTDLGTTDRVREENSILNSVVQQEPLRQIKRVKQPKTNLSKSSNHLDALHKTRKNLPEYLIPFKDLVLNTWKGKVVNPTQEETVLLSNCLGMLSLHSEMTESVHEIKDYQFNEQTRYLAVPSQSNKNLSNADKKFKRAAQNNPDLKQQLINVNIQQLDQTVEIEDVQDYLQQDIY